MTKSLFIPPLGTEIELSEPWTFTLHAEHRNHDMHEYLGKSCTYYPPSSTVVTLPEGSVLKIERIYIRKGRGDFDSVTFRLKKSSGSVRFWAKLDEVNRIILK